MIGVIKKHWLACIIFKSRGSFSASQILHEIPIWAIKIISRLIFCFVDRSLIVFSCSIATCNRNKKWIFWIPLSTDINKNNKNVFFPDDAETWFVLSLCFNVYNSCFSLCLIFGQAENLEHKLTYTHERTLVKLGSNCRWMKIMLDHACFSFLLSVVDSLQII